MLNLSTGLRSRLLGDEGLATLLLGGVIRIFSGPQPANADMAEQGTLLGVVTLNAEAWQAGHLSNGLTLDHVGLYVVKPYTARWMFTARATGNAGWFRYVANAPDAGITSITAVRMDGQIGTTTSPKEMIWDSPAVEQGTSYPIDSFIFTLPPLPAS